MLNSDTKRHIDAARDVLVGVAPNPMTQIDQITYALIYKFMDDMDQASINAGGEPSFFVGELEPFAWSRLLDSRMGNQERMNLYGEALQKFSEAKQLPELFRTIFRAAFLPYRSPETLGLFLKEISHFDYSHPEELGNAYEYLLSIMSSQGDAGQFRTPRHIIDFMVDVMNPTKDDKVLDPACGTGGFLVATYNHILEQHDGRDDPNKTEQPLTPDERKKLMNNLEGYDIDPSMVRIAQVNMYLHQFKNPQIFQYDSLTSEERWNDKFDVILANPPFMSPKGGIKPHSKFALESSRSEVLFVDYIVNHLKPKGRAGIIVPEGIIFQSGKAYKQLRKELVEGGLYGVVSLPAGVFNPYSGVKTSILLINNEIAKQRDEILFVKIAADGYHLGATKRQIANNDLPEALEILKQFALNEHTETSKALLVSKKAIADSNDYNLTADRYQASTQQLSNWPLVELQEIASIRKGSAITAKEARFGIVPVIAGGQTPAYFHDEANRPANTITVSASGAYAGYVSMHEMPIFASDCSTIEAKDSSLVSTKYLFYILKHLQEDIYKLQRGGGQPHVYPKDLVSIQIPLPPLEVQEQIVVELDGYAAIIDGARKIAENWKPIIDLDPEWDAFALGDLCNVYQPKTISGSQVLKSGPYVVYGANGPIGYYDEYNHEESEVTVTCRGATCGTVNFTEPQSWITGNAMVLSPKDQRVTKGFLKFLLSSVSLAPVITGSAQPQITGSSLKPFKVPLPPVDTQEEIASGLEKQEELIGANSALAEKYESLISKTIEALWNE